ncbi:MAG: beta-glucosidase [Balneola sp.]|nr:beta-glucosidase [Balneola sp.]MBE79755.1 beta-glucosidase [Balneola sp.]|tara:strand:+ start:8506 stop:10743 length:2238 start_codon:yes stop_codon:yes gene_type:complete
MNKRIIPLLTLLLTLVANYTLAQDASIDQKIDQLIDQMTVEEKAGQMTQLNITTIVNGEQNDVNLVREKAINLIKNHHIGSFLNGEAVPADQWFTYMSELMEISMDNSRLEIPIIYGIDHMHGASYIANSTIFPHNLNIGATFEPEHARQNARVTGIESADLGHHWIFAPVLDLGKNPLWPRIYETYGEDPYVAEVMGAEYVKSLQNNPETAPYKQAATAKHFIGYSDPIEGWDRTPALIPDQHLHEFFVPAFKSAIEAGISTVMINSAEINGVPVHASKELLTGLLRDHLGFEGVAVTDWADIDQLVTKHRVAPNLKEATFLAVEAGIDMSMTPYDLSFTNALIELVQEGRITEERLDLSVRRILKLKFELGLFENPYPSDDRLDLIGKDEHKELAYKAAVESIVLLKNENNVLPLSSDVQNILVVGPSANSKRNLNGGWTLAWQGGDEERYPDDVETIFTATQKAFPNASVEYIDDISSQNMETIMAKANSADAVFYAMGETPYTEGVGNINTLLLPNEQQNLIDATSGVDAAKIFVYVGGRPRIITDMVDNVDAVLFAGLPGNEGGKAIANIISGMEVPSAKLPITYPKFPGVFYPYNHKVAVFTPSTQANEEFVGTTLYEFGAGLSYTSFEYSDLKLSSTEVSKDGTIEATVTVKNTGDITGKEAVLWFLSDAYASITRPVKELQHFEKIELEAGEEKTLSFTINPMENLSFPDKNGNLLLEAGAFTLTVGDHSQEFTLTD